MTTPLILNHVRETSIVENLDDIVLLGPTTGRMAFNSYTINDGDLLAYLVDDNQGNWESGIGSYNSDPNSITRITVISNSEQNTDKIVFSPGTKTVLSVMDAKIAQQLLDLIPYPFW